jgi:hypothetical protein
MYDIIGDIHGHGNDLIQLLNHLGYQINEKGYYAHQTHNAIFLGDFIDRGRNQKLVLDTVIPMVKNGTAYAVMGNHEYNAIGFHTPDPKHKGVYLRPRNNKNIRQHIAFLNGYIDNPDELNYVIKFFKSLPLWLEIEGIRIIHACWDQQWIDVIKSKIGGNIMTDEFFIAANTIGTKEFYAVERILKGVEISLPEGFSFNDKDNNTRTAIRADWWNQKAKYIKDYDSAKKWDIGEAKHFPIPDDVPKYSENLPLCFIGHYWHSGRPKALSKNIACLDYSVAKGHDGKLVAYRWQGESVINDEHFVYV